MCTMFESVTAIKARLTRRAGTQHTFGNQGKHQKGLSEYTEAT